MGYAILIRIKLCIYGTHACEHKRVAFVTVFSSACLCETGLSYSLELGIY